MESLGVTLGLLWGHFGATLKLLGGTWGALGDHWELDGTFLGGFWCLEGLLGGPWGELGRVLEAYKQETLIFASETKGRATKTQTRVGRKEGARRVQGGCEEGVSMCRKESGSRQVPLETIKKKR